MSAPRTARSPRKSAAQKRADAATAAAAQAPVAEVVAESVADSVEAAPVAVKADRLCRACGQAGLVGRNLVHDDCLKTAKRTVEAAESTGQVEEDEAATVAGLTELLPSV